MKKQIGLVLAAVVVIFCSVQVHAQGKWSTEELKVSISLGYGSITAPSLDNSGVINGILNRKILNLQTRTTTTGALGVQCGFEITNRFGLGATLIYQGIERDITGASYFEHQQYAYYTLLLNATHAYAHKPEFDFYCRMGLGVSVKQAESFSGHSKSPATKSEELVFLGYQFSPVGIRLGETLFFKLEAGYGYMGVLSVFAGYRF